MSKHTTTEYEYEVYDHKKEQQQTFDVNTTVFI